MDKLKIAILGATSHIAKSLLYRFISENNCSLSLYSRSPEKVKEFINSHIRTNDKNYQVLSSYDNLTASQFDVIINCIGVGTLKKLNENFSNFFTVTEKFDNLCIENLTLYPETLYISVSSGAVYGTSFNEPVNENTINELNINHIKPEEYYTIARINAENKHRSFNKLKIVDLRIFSYFSRFIDLSDSYFITEIIKSIINKSTFITNKFDMVRDYVHPEDLYSLMLKCIQTGFINDAFDVMSTKPVSKFEVLDFFSKEYNLKYKIEENFEFKNSTGLKSVYYSSFNKAVKIGFFPQFSSADVIKSEVGHIFKSLLKKL